MWCVGTAGAPSTHRAHELDGEHGVHGLLDNGGRVVFVSFLGQRQRRHAVRRLLRHVGALLDEVRDHLLVAVVGGEVQRRLPGRVLALEVHSVALDESLRRQQVAAAGRRDERDLRHDATLSVRCTFNPTPPATVSFACGGTGTAAALPVAPVCLLPRARRAPVSNALCVTRSCFRGPLRNVKHRPMPQGAYTRNSQARAASAVDVPRW